jgi:hypothetical protein
MAVLTFTEIEEGLLNALVANPATDAPFATAEKLRAVNEAYAQVWEIGGPSVKNVASATAWTTADTATGVVTGILQEINEILHVYASSTSGSVGVSSGDNELDRVELSMLEWLRKSNLTGTYTRPQCYAISRISTGNVAAAVNLIQLNYWPSVTGFFFPIKYLPQFTPAASIGSTVPDVNDLESYDIAWLAAADLAPRIGRSDLVPGLLMKVSSGTAKALERKMAAMMSGDQDNAGAA